MISIASSHISFYQFWFNWRAPWCRKSLRKLIQIAFYKLNHRHLLHLPALRPISSQFFNWVIKFAPPPNNNFLFPARHIKTPARYKSIPEQEKAFVDSDLRVNGRRRQSEINFSFPFSLFHQKIEIEKLFLSLNLILFINLASHRNVKLFIRAFVSSFE